VRLVSRAWRGAVTEFATYQHSPLTWSEGEHAAVVDLFRWGIDMQPWGLDPDEIARRLQLARRHDGTAGDDAVNARAWCVDISARRCIAFVDWGRTLSAAPSGVTPGGEFPLQLRCPFGANLSAPLAASWLRQCLPHLTELVVGCACHHLKSLVYGSGPDYKKTLVDSTPSVVVPTAAVPRVTALTLTDANQLDPALFGHACATLFPQLTALDLDGRPECPSGFRVPQLPKLRKLRLADGLFFANAAAQRIWPFAAFLRACPGVTNLTLQGSFAAQAVHGSEMVPDTVMAVMELTHVADLFVGGCMSGGDGRESARLLARLAPNDVLMHVHIDGLVDSDIAAFVASGQLPRLATVNGRRV
jgi:hypothetical protein